jgi:hypothetical protein
MNCSLPFPKPDTETPLEGNLAAGQFQNHDFEHFPMPVVNFHRNGPGALFPPLNICANGAENSNLFRSFREEQTNKQSFKRKTMNAIMDQMIESDHHSFASEEKSVGDFGSSTSNSSRGVDQRAAGKRFPWWDQIFDRPCAVSSPLNEW